MRNYRPYCGLCGTEKLPLHFDGHGYVCELCAADVYGCRRKDVSDILKSNITKE